MRISDWSSDVCSSDLPSFAYPYFSGYRHEHGRGAGVGANLNLPLPETITPEQYRAALGEALKRVARFRPAWLILACGFDTAVGDPTGSWPHRPDDFTTIGRTIGEAGWPILVVQEEIGRAHSELQSLMR